jgi:hypothetical protein
MSEPLDDASEHWTEVPDSHLLIAEQGRINVTRIGREHRPRAPRRPARNSPSTTAAAGRVESLRL